MKLLACFCITLSLWLGIVLPVQGFFHGSSIARTAQRSRSWLSSPHASLSTPRLHATLQRELSDGFALKDVDWNEDSKLGVLFLNLGGPETIDDVEGFLYNLFADPDIIRIPSFLSALQKPLAFLISKTRSPKSTEAYRSIGGGSPIVQYTQAQADLVQEQLRERGYKNAKCYFAMRYWKPYTEEVLQKMREDGVNNLVIVPLYPQFSISTSGSSLRLLRDIFQKAPHLWGEDKVAHTVVPAWYQRPGYLKAMAKLIIEQIQEYQVPNMQEGLHVLFSAHGVPQSYIKDGDPYQRQIEDCVELIAREVQTQLLQSSALPKPLATKLAGRASTEVEYSQEERTVKPVDFHLSFQSRVGPVKWLQPYTEDTLEMLGEQGVKNLIVVPVSFVSEHIETLEEIDMEYKELAHEAGITNWRRAPALNTEPLFIADMVDLVQEALESPAVSLADAMSSAYFDTMVSKYHDSSVIL